MLTIWYDTSSLLGANQGEAINNCPTLWSLLSICIELSTKAIISGLKTLSSGGKLDNLKDAVPLVNHLVTKDPIGDFGNKVPIGF